MNKNHCSNRRDLDEFILPTNFGKFIRLLVVLYS